MQARLDEMESIGERARKLVETGSDHNIDDATIEQFRAALNKDYNAFVKKRGSLLNRTNVSLTRRAKNGAMIRVLELCDQDQNCEPAPILIQRQIELAPTADVQTVPDAMTLAYQESGKIDFNRIGEIISMSPADVRQSLKQQGLIFQNPTDLEYEPADVYLSGDVREKLKVAEFAAKRNPEFQQNVQALENIQPPMIRSADIITRAWARCGFHKRLSTIGCGSRLASVVRTGRQCMSIIPPPATGRMKRPKGGNGFMGMTGP